MSNRLKEAFESKRKLLSIYFTAGYPNIDDTRAIIRGLQDSGVDMIEIGLNRIVAQLEEIGATASKEYALETAMARMKAEWTEVVFECQPYR